MFAKIIIDQDAKALDKVFEYKIPDDMQVEVGERVMVPFGARNLQGFIVEICTECSYDESKVKPIASKIENFPVIKKEMLQIKEKYAGERKTKIVDSFLHRRNCLRVISSPNR